MALPLGPNFRSATCRFYKPSCISFTCTKCW